MSYLACGGPAGEEEIRLEWHYDQQTFVELNAPNITKPYAVNILFNPVNASGAISGGGVSIRTTILPNTPRVLNLKGVGANLTNEAGGSMRISAQGVGTQVVSEIDNYAKEIALASMRLVDEKVYFDKRATFKLTGKGPNGDVVGLTSGVEVYCQPEEALHGVTVGSDDQLLIQFKSGYPEVTLYSTVYGKMTNKITVSPEVFVEPPYLASPATVDLVEIYGPAGQDEARGVNLHLTEMNNIVLDVKGISGVVRGNLEYRVAKLPPQIVPATFKPGRNVFKFTLPKGAKVNDEVIIIAYGASVDGALLAESRMVYAVNLIQLTAAPMVSSTKANVDITINAVANTEAGSIALPANTKLVCKPANSLVSAGVSGNMSMKAKFNATKSSVQIALLVHGKLSNWSTVTITP